MKRKEGKSDVHFHFGDLGNVLFALVLFFGAVMFIIVITEGMRADESSYKSCLNECSKAGFSHGFAFVSEVSGCFPNDVAVCVESCNELYLRLVG